MDNSPRPGTDEDHDFIYLGKWSYDKDDDDQKAAIHEIEDIIDDYEDEDDKDDNKRVLHGFNLLIVDIVFCNLAL